MKYIAHRNCGPKKNKRKVSPNVSLLLQQKGLRRDAYSLICNNCRLRVCSTQNATFNVDDIQGMTKESSKYTCNTLPILSVGKSHRVCAICRTNKSKL